VAAGRELWPPDFGLGGHSMKTAFLRSAFAPVALLCLLLGGCATSTMSLSLNELQSIRIDRVEIVYTEEAQIFWETEETAYVEKVKAEQVASGEHKPWKQVLEEDKKRAEGEFQRIINTPEARQHLRDLLKAKINQRVSAAIVPLFQGTRPVVMEITIHIFTIRGPVQRVVLGGTPVLGAVTVLKDAQTGEELAKLDRAAAGYAGNGWLGVLVDQAFDDLDDRVMDQYINNLLSWLNTNKDV
jgi:hypothetical protein